ncbi:hypothetical protein DMN91_004562 [Ooceraea biroi]|uniref:1-phosphatidylinositol 4,5-bisphosphate phosphodiesterase n=1 Tax=Ooceraea biroi TaxID=2015173 RepID=A0A3L8DPC3_OOCBI|nr:1-phosphatidylinositol 4,5-bisphosphate phosphodiesterase classes I and II isoform X3 [Ooceraea biroi]RLU22284.1 hypothetical protein DMN91_004562 [Ooceraea biroi]
MASAGNKSTAVTMQTKPVEVSQQLQDGEKFIKWDEDSGIVTPVTLKVDKYGFYLHWVDQNHEMDMLDIAVIRDTRTGKYAKMPKDAKLKSLVTMGSQDSLEEKTLTICYGSDFVNMNFLHFCTMRSEIAQHWADQLFQLAYNLIQLNTSTTMFLLKAHTKLTLTADKSEKIPVKNIIRMFTQNKEDRKRVEKALDISGFPSGKNDVVPLSKFQFEDFFNFYKSLTQRSDVEKVFEGIVRGDGNSKRRLMSVSQFVDFLNKTQRDPRLNEILYPYASEARAKDIINQYEPNKCNANKGQLSFDGFLRYLMSEDNPIVAVSKVELSDDMDQSLAHYFINSSHNTYLTGHQLTGRSSVEIYRQCLLAGCRCVELDFWNGKVDEPVIVHGYTLVPEIYARDVIEAIAETAFKTSEFPVILSFENHCNPRQQAKIAQYCREVFGEMLLDAPLESHKLEPGQELPPPSLLKRKIIIKNKKKHHHHHKKHLKKQQQVLEIVEGTPDSETNGTANPSAAGENGPPPDVIPQNELEPDGVAVGNDQQIGNGDIPHPPMLQQRQGSKDSAQDDEDEEEESSTEEDESNVEDMKMRLGDKAVPDKASSAKETEAGAEISALVNYVQPVHFNSFESAEKKNRMYEMSSFDEKQATTLLKEKPLEFVNYNKHQLSRVYPAGTRFDSSNFMPQVFWNTGCQLVALNYQTLDLAMQLNLGIFEYNQRCGYLLKPEFMRRKDRRLDPFAESIVDGIIAGTVHIHVISAQFLTDKRVGTYVEVDMYGLPADTVRKKFRTKIVPNNGINPIYDEEPFVFKKVVLPELASIRIAAYEESGRLIGHRVLPVVGLCPGYRHVSLRTECGQPLPLASLFLHVIVKDYVPDGLSELAEALANPIKYQSEVEKRENQLLVLTDCLEAPDEIEDKSKVSDASSSAKPATEEVVKTKRMQSIGELPSTLLPTSTSLHGRPSIAGLSSSETMDLEDDVPFSAVQSVDTSLNKSPINASSMSDEVVAESLDKLMENKLVREKKLELEKKLESLRKKHEKEKMRAQSQKGSLDGEKHRSKFYMSNRLVKRLSSKNISFSSEVGLSTLAMSAESSECAENAENREGNDGGTRGLPRSQSERFLAICKAHVQQERELQEKYYESLFATVEKVMRSSQSNQLKTLQVLFDRETADVKRKLQATRQGEVKQLAKVHKDKAELERIKREVAKSTVEKAVNECTRLTKIYDKKRAELERQHEEVRQRLEEERAKVKANLLAEYSSRYSKYESGELPLSPSGGASMPESLSENTY